MRKLLLLSLVSLFALLFSAPLIQFVFQVVPEKKLRGFTMPKPPVEPTLESVLDGSFQERAELWFLRRHGFWGHLVRLENQINFDVFRQISASYKASLARGNEGWLFQTSYLDSYNGRAVHPEELLQTRAQQIRVLQDLLAARGIGLLLLISTNKVAVHPEIVPERYQAPYFGLRPNTYQRMMPMLDAAGVNYFDTNQYFIERTKSSDIRYFTPSGSHWNDVGACLVSNEIVSRMEKWLQKDLTHFSCSPIKFKEKPRPTDLDLAYIANLWDSSLYHQTTPYPATETKPPQELVRPKVLFLGTSFIWSILRFMDYHKVYRYSDFLYYYNRLRNYPSGRQHPFDRAKMDWEAQILSNDFIVMEINMASLQDAGFEFVVDAIDYLSRAKPE